MNSLFPDTLSQKKSLFQFFLLIFFLNIPFTLHSQQKSKYTTANYALAKKFTPKNINRLISDLRVQPNWIGDTDKFWYSYRTPDERQYYIVDPETRSKIEMFEKSEMAAKLSNLLIRKFDANNLRLTDLKFVKNNSAIQFKIGTNHYEYEFSSKNLIKIEPPQKSGQQEWESYSPDGKLMVFARNYNLFLKETDNPGKEVQITSDGECYYGYNVAEMGYVGEEEKNFGKPRKADIDWSPDSKKFFTIRADARHLNDLWVINTLTKPRPSLITFKCDLPAEDVRKSDISRLVDAGWQMPEMFVTKADDDSTNI